MPWNPSAPGSTSQADNQYLPTGDRNSAAPGLLWGFFGDSLIQGSGALNAAFGLAQQAVTVSGGMVCRPDSINSGKAGHTTALLVNRMENFFNRGPEAVVLMAGTNDAEQAVPLTTTVKNLDTILTRCRIGAVPVVLCTIPPRTLAGGTTAKHLATEAINTWIRLNARSYGAVLADVAAALVDPATGYLLAAYDSGDGVHPSNLGHQVAGAVLADAMTAARWGNDRSYGIISGPAAGLVTNDPLNARTGGVISGSVAEWGGGSGTAPTYSMVNDLSGFLPYGRWAEMDFNATAGGTRRLTNYSVGGSGSGFAAGNRMLTVAHLQVEDVSTTKTWRADVAAGNAAWEMSIVNQSGVSVLNGVMSRNGGVEIAANVFDLGPLLIPFTVPAGTTELNTWFSATVPTGRRFKCRVGCYGLINLTSRGLASSFPSSITMVQD